MDKSEIVRILQEIATRLELAEANPFEVIAYRNGAQYLDDWDGDLAGAVADGTLTDIYGIGKGIARAVADLATQGRCDKYDQLRSEYPDGILQMLKVPGLGVKKIRTLYRDLGVDSLDRLEQAARDERIRSLPGFGAKSEERIIRGVERARRYLEREGGA